MAKITKNGSRLVIDGVSQTPINDIGIASNDLKIWITDRRTTKQILQPTLYTDIQKDDDTFCIDKADCLAYFELFSTGDVFNPPIPQSDVTGLEGRFEAIENQNITATLYEVINTGTTSGSLATQTGVTIIRDSFGGADLDISEVGPENYPNSETVFDSLGDIVSANFNPVDTPPDWQLDNPDTNGQNYALIFRVQGTRTIIDSYINANSYGLIDDRAEVSLQSAYNGGSLIKKGAESIEIRGAGIFLRARNADGTEEYYRLNENGIRTRNAILSAVDSLGNVELSLFSSDGLGGVAQNALIRILPSDTLLRIGSDVDPELAIDLVNKKLTTLVSNYETLVTSDNDIPNRKFVTDSQAIQDAAIALNTAKVSADGSINTHSDVDLTGVTIQDNSVLRWNDGLNAFIPCLDVLVKASALVINNTNVLQDIVNTNINITRLTPHLITVNYSWSLNDAAQDFISSASFGGQDLLTSLTDSSIIHQQEPKDVAGPDPDGRGTNQRHTYSKTFELTPTTLGNNQLLLQFAGSANGDLASIWDVVIRIEELTEVITL